MGDKAQGSRPVTPKPQLWNRVVDSMTRHEQQQRLGKGKPPKPFVLDKNIIKCKNNVGTNLTRGSVVDVGDYLLTGLSSYEPATLWFNGDEPAGGHYAVFRGAVPDDEYADAQLTGVCIARVNVLDNDHDFAVPTSGQTYFTSASEGEIQILDKPTGDPGVKECVVVLRCGGAAGVADFQYGATVDSIPGVDNDPGTYPWNLERYSSGTVALLQLDAGGDDDFATYPGAPTVEAYNISPVDMSSSFPVKLYRSLDYATGGQVYFCEPWYKNNYGDYQGTPLFAVSAGVESVGTSETGLGFTVAAPTFGLMTNDTASSPDRIQFDRFASYLLHLTVFDSGNGSNGILTISFAGASGEIAIDPWYQFTFPMVSAGALTHHFTVAVKPIAFAAKPTLYVTAQRSTGGSGNVYCDGHLQLLSR